MTKRSANLLLSGMAISIFALAGSTSPAMSKCIQTHPIFGIDVYVEDKYCEKKPAEVKAVKKKAPRVVKRQKAKPVMAAKPDNRIMKMQSLLSGMGYDAGPADGYDGPQTRKAAGAFNLANGLPEKASAGSTMAVLTMLTGKHKSPAIAKPVAVAAAKTVAAPKVVATAKAVAAPKTVAATTKTVAAPKIVAAAPKAVMVSTSTPAIASARIRDSRIHKMQSLLASMGYNPGPVDGYDKPETRQAAVAFNIANDLPKKASISSTIAVLTGLRGTP